jgi:LuxR family maltose regulon positive regulatory protein
MDEAIRHALLANDMERATRLVDHIAASLIVRREANRLLRLVDPLPPNLCYNYPMLCLWHAWALFFAGELDRVESMLQRAETSPDPARQSPLPGYATTVRAYLANNRGNLQEAIDLAQRALEQMNEAPDDRTTLIFRGAAVLWLGVNHRLLGELDQATKLYAEAATLNQEAGNYYGALASIEQAADVAQVRGQLHRAAELYRRALLLADRWYRREGMVPGSLPAATGPHLGLGTVLYQWNDLEAAAPHILRAVELGELEQAWWRIHSYRMQAFLKWAQGDPVAAYDYLGQACAIWEELTFHQVNVSAQPSLEQLRILLSRTGPEMSHLLSDAVRQVESLGLDLARQAHTLDFAEPANYAREADYADLARVMVASGRAAEVLPLIEGLVEAAETMGRHGDEIRYLALQALALRDEGDTASPGEPGSGPDSGRARGLCAGLCGRRSADGGLAGPGSFAGYRARLCWRTAGRISRADAAGRRARGGCASRCPTAD